MQIVLVGIGKTDERALELLIDKYVKRIAYYTSFDLMMLPDLKNRKSLTIEQQKKKEATILKAVLRPQDVLILMDEAGCDLKSIQWADQMARYQLQSTKRLIFMMGGPYGFDASMHPLAQACWRLSSLTFSHQMVRLFLVEQIYRAFTIIKGQSYHH